MFKPERWTEETDRKRLDRYMTTFGKGTRSCLGINLAYCELFLTLAAVFRRFDLKLVGTTFDDVIMARDLALAAPKPGAKPIQIKVKEKHRDTSLA